jgi:hypothetical protein
LLRHFTLFDLGSLYILTPDTRRIDPEYFNAGQIDLPDVKGNVEKFNYQYEIDLAVSGDTARILSPVYGVSKPIAKVGKVDAPHLAFWFSISRPPTTSPDDYYFERLKHFVDFLQKGPTRDLGALADKLSSMLGIDRDKARSFIDADGDKSIRATFTRALSNALEEAHKRHKGSGVFDFTDSRGARDLARNLRGLTIGGEKDAKVTKLIVDVVSASVSVDVELTSKEQVTQDEALGTLVGLWTNKDEEEEKHFKTALANVKEVCEKLHQKCRSLSEQFKISPEVCGNIPRYESVALEPLNPLVTLPSSEAALEVVQKLPQGDLTHLLLKPLGMLGAVTERDDQCDAVVISKDHILAAPYCREVIEELSEDNRDIGFYTTNVELGLGSPARQGGLSANGCCYVLELKPDNTEKIRLSKLDHPSVRVPLKGYVTIHTMMPGPAKDTGVVSVRTPEVGEGVLLVDQSDRLTRVRQTTLNRRCRVVNDGQGIFDVSCEGFTPPEGVVFAVSDGAFLGFYENFKQHDRFDYLRRWTDFTGDGFLIPVVGLLRASQTFPSYDGDQKQR